MVWVCIISLVVSFTSWDVLLCFCFCLTFIRLVILCDCVLPEVSGKLCSITFAFVTFNFDCVVVMVVVLFSFFFVPLQTNLDTLALISNYKFYFSGLLALLLTQFFCSLSRAHTLSQSVTQLHYATTSAKGGLFTFDFLLLLFRRCLSCWCAVQTMVDSHTTNHQHSLEESCFTQSFLLRFSFTQSLIKLN